MQEASLSRRRGPIAVWAADPDLRDRIRAALELAGHEVVDCFQPDEPMPFEENLIGAGVSQAQALVVASAQQEFVDDVRLRPPSSTGLPRVVVATGSWNAWGWKSVRSGAEGLVREPELEQTLAASVDAVLADQLCLPGTMRDALARPILSHREKQVLQLALSGLTNAQVAGRLFLSESTVKSHLSSSFRKLRVTSRAEAARRVRVPPPGWGARRGRLPELSLPAGRRA